MKGWFDFINGDPSPALKAIATRNPKMTEAFLEFSYQSIKSEKLVMGKMDTFGQLDPIRLERLIDQMKTFGIVENKQIEDWYTVQFVDEALESEF